MLALLDELLRHLLLTRIDELAVGEQVGFEPPDENWRNAVTNLGDRRAVNLYLVQLTENRKLRSNAADRTVTDGVAADQPAPARLDCHYMITAWDPAVPGPLVEPTVAEHNLLYRVAGAIATTAPIVADEIYFPDPAPSGWGRHSGAELPTQIAPEDGFSTPAEFWARMGDGARWKPTLEVVVTIPVELAVRVAGPIVTTRVIEFRNRTAADDQGEFLVQIAGSVLDASIDPEEALPDAWVRLETPAGLPIATTTTDTAGHFTFGGLSPGPYRLRWRHGPHPEPPPRSVEVPSPTGEYDLRFD